MLSPHTLEILLGLVGSAWRSARAGLSSVTSTLLSLVLSDRDEGLPLCRQ